MNLREKYVDVRLERAASKAATSLVPWLSEHSTDRVQIGVARQPLVSSRPENEYMSKIANRIVEKLGSLGCTESLAYMPEPSEQVTIKFSAISYYGMNAGSVNPQLVFEREG